MNPQQRSILLGWIQSAIHSATWALVWRLPLWAQIALVAGGLGTLMWFAS